MSTKTATWVALGVAVANAVCLIALPARLGRAIVLFCLIGALLAAGLALLRKAQLQKATLGVLGAALLLYSAYLSCTGFSERNYDPAAHLKYIRTIAENHTLPSGADCTICHHPPLYHLLAAGVYDLVQPLGSVSVPFVLQFFSLGAFCVFLVYGTLTVARLVTNPRLEPWGAAFIAFWPSSVLNSVRLNNDLLLYPIVAAGMFYLVRWRQEKSLRDLYIAALLAGAAVFTKLNGLVLIALLGALLLWDIAKSQAWKRTAKQLAPALLLLLASVVAVVGHKAYREQGNLAHRAFGSAAVSELEAKHWKRQPLSYVSLDLQQYWTEPYSVCEFRQKDDPPYWNHVLKSSLFGTRNEFTWGDGPTFFPSRSLAIRESWALAAGLVYVLVGAAIVRRRPEKRHLLAGALMLGFIGASICFHIWAPKPHHTDFRFMYPVLVPAAALYLEMTEALKKRNRYVGYFGYGLLVLFIGMSVLYFATALRPSAKALADRINPATAEATQTGLPFRLGPAFRKPR